MPPSPILAPMKGWYRNRGQGLRGKNKAEGRILCVYVLGGVGVVVTKEIHFGVRINLNITTVGSLRVMRFVCVCVCVCVRVSVRECVLCVLCVCRQAVTCRHLTCTIPRTTT